MTDLVAYEMHFRCMECGRRMCTISHAADHHGRISIQDHTRRHLVLHHRKVPITDRLSPLLHTLVGERAGPDSPRTLDPGEFHVPLDFLASFTSTRTNLISGVFPDTLLLIVMTTAMRKIFTKDSTTGISTVHLMGHQVIILNPPTAGRPIEAAILATEGTMQTKDQAAGSLALDLIHTTMDPRIVAEEATSTTYNGLRPGLVVTVDNKALARDTLTNHRPHLLGRRPQTTHCLLGHPTMRTISDLRTGIFREKMVGMIKLIQGQKAMTLRPCHLQPVNQMYRHPQTKVGNSVLPSRRRPRQPPLQSLFQISRSGCRSASHPLVRLNRQPLATA